MRVSATIRLRLPPISAGLSRRFQDGVLARDPLSTRLSWLALNLVERC